ncbi:MAG: hypothetical protein Q8P20_07025 [bacterium]|nr:hypothetical protein [bacterium]
MEEINSISAKVIIMTGRKLWSEEKKKLDKIQDLDKAIKDFEKWKKLKEKEGIYPGAIAICTEASIHYFYDKKNKLDKEKI